MGDQAHPAEPAYAAQIRADLRGPDLPATLNDLALGYRTATKELTTLKAQPGIRVPGPDAKPEEIQAFHKALGVPDNPDGYGIAPPEGMPADEVKTFVAEAHKQGLTKAQIQGALAFYQGSVKRALENYGKRSAEQSVATVAALKSELAGGDETKFKGMAERVDRLLEAKGGAKLKAELANASKDTPELFKFLVKEIVPLFKEDASPVGALPGGSTRQGGEPTKEQLKTWYPNSPHMFEHGA